MTTPTAIRFTSFVPDIAPALASRASEVDREGRFVHDHSTACVPCGR